jgi:apolipoprotein D and lipocalin family protein
LQQDNGTVAVNNTCQAQGQAINILGTAAPANPTYGAAGVFQVGFPGQAGPSCPGPNYIVQGESVFDLSRIWLSELRG